MFAALSLGTTFTGIELSNSQDKTACYSLTLKKTKNELTLEKQASFASFKACLQNTNPKTPVLININNQQVLYKTSDKKFNSYEEAAHFCFPSLQTKDFYIELTSTPTLSLVSACRKEVVTELLETCKKNQRALLGFSLGNGLLTKLIPYAKENHLRSSNAKLLMDTEKNLLSIQPTTNRIPHSYELNGLELPHTHMNPFAAILSLSNNTIPQDNNFVGQNKALYQQLVSGRIHNYGLRFALLFIFGMLLVNAILFKGLVNQIEALQQDLTFAEELRSKQKNLSAIIEHKKSLVSNLTDNSKSTVSLYLDAIGASVPKSVMLTSLYFQPLTKKAKPEQKIQFKTGQLLISGTASNGKEFTQWIRDLEAKEWVQSLSIQDYGIGKKTTTRFAFLLKL